MLRLEGQEKGRRRCLYPGERGLTCRKEGPATGPGVSQEESEGGRTCASETRAKDTGETQRTSELAQGGAGRGCADEDPSESRAQESSIAELTDAEPGVVITGTGVEGKGERLVKQHRLPAVR